MNLVKVASAIIPVALLAGAGVAYLTRSAPGGDGNIAAASAGAAINLPTRQINHFKQFTPVTQLRPVTQIKPVTPLKPVRPVTQFKPVRPVTPLKPVTPIAVGHSRPSASSRFKDWRNGQGGALLENDFAVLAKTESDAAAGNVAAVEADAGALIAAGNASLADPPPAGTATWDAAFAAQVLAGQDIEARNLAGAEAEANIVKADIYAFNSQTS